MRFMECQTCRAIVQTNNVGVCLGCQRGFVGIPQEDTWKEGEYGQNQDNTAKTMADLVKRKEEIEDAIKEGLQSEDDQQKHQERDAKRKATKTGGRNSAKRGKKGEKEG